MNDLIPLLLFALSTTLTPGPNNFMLLNSGLHFGIKKSLPHYLGICVGFPLMMLIVSLGLGQLFLQHLWIKHFLKIFGSLYMLYLAWQILDASAQVKMNKQLKPFGFFQAILFQWINPKAWLMAIGAISIFSLTANYFNNAMTIGTVFLFMCLPCIGIWMIFGKFLQQILTEEKHRKWFNIVMATCLIASVIMMLFE